MRADYDSEADALSRFKHYDYQEQVHDSWRTVGFAGGRLVDVELLTPAKHLDLLQVAAERYDLSAPIAA